MSSAASRISGRGRGLAGSRLFAVFVAMTVSACATTPYSPGDVDSLDLRQRAQEQSEGEITVRAAVPGPEETRALFDLPLYDRGIQPVWLDIHNGTNSGIRYAPVGTDREYFAPLEVAYVHRGSFSDQGRADMNRYFYDNAMPRRIPAGETRSGFVFTHARPGTKGFNVDLFGPDREHDVSFTFFIDVPGFEPDHSDVYFETLYEPDDIRDLDRDEFRAELPAMDLRTRDRDGGAGGAPINALVIGEGAVVLEALIRSNWVETPRPDAELASDSQLYLGRSADVVFRKNVSADGERNELRFWLAPMRVDGLPVWLGQATHHIGLRKGRSQLDPDVDDAMTYFLQDIWYGQSLARYGWVRQPAAASIDAPLRTAEGDPYFTSGNVLVIWPSDEAVSMLEADALDWGSGPVRERR